MPKHEYDIEGRTFHVEKAEAGWIGCFVDDPKTVYTDQLKMDVLRQAGYLPRSSAGLVVSIGTKIYEYAPPRTMQDAYDDFRQRLADGHFPKFKRDKPLSKFVILARDRCECIYCGQVPEQSCEAQLDHVIPIGAGGPSTAGNLVTACRTCNVSKGDTRLLNESEILQMIHVRNGVAQIDDAHTVEMFERC